MTVYIKVKKRFGITERDQSIRYFEPGVYEVEDAIAKMDFVKAHSSRIANPDDRFEAAACCSSDDTAAPHDFYSTAAGSERRGKRSLRLSLTIPRLTPSMRLRGRKKPPSLILCLRRLLSWFTGAQAGDAGRHDRRCGRWL